MKCGHYILLLVLIAFCGCSQNAKNEPETSAGYTDSLVVVTEEYRLYLCSHEWTGIILGEQDPGAIDFGMWRIPTKNEAAVLHTKYIHADTDQRFLCIAPDGYYSFCFSKVGNITKAGSKTKYAIRPIRKVYNPKDTIIQL